MRAKAMRGRSRASQRWSKFLNLLKNPSPSSGIDASVLEDRTLYSASPILLADVDFNVHEDAPNTKLHLPDLFGLDDSGAQVQYQLLSTADSRVFDSLHIDSAGNLQFDFAANQHGKTHVTLQARDAAGNVEQLSLNVLLESVNDTPTMHNLQNFTVTDASSGTTVIDLFGAFDDVEDADRDLTFQVINNSNASLFLSTTIDMERGLLILQHAPGQSGTAELTITATDTGGLSVGMPVSDDFQVYSRMRGDAGVDRPDFEALGIQHIELATSWYLFDYQNGEYDFSSLAVDRLTKYLTTYSRDPDIPVVLDIENSYYVNTPEGRDRFAEAFALAKQIRPDLEIGIYRIMPERSYHYPVSWGIAQQHEEWGLSTFYTERAARYEQNYQEWQDRNELYRTEPVSEVYGGKPLADMIDSINPSLYTFYRNVNGLYSFQPAMFDAASDRITVEGPSFEGVDVVRIERATGSTLNPELREATDYYVVNYQDDSFQLALSPGGQPIDIRADSVGDLFLAAKGPDWNNLWHDPSVQNWRIYAEENIAEARKFGKPVYAWISPTVKTEDRPYLDADFFRWQMEILKPLVDGIVIYADDYDPVEVDLQHGWTSALTDFMQTLQQPAGKVSIAVSGHSSPYPAPPPAPSNDAPFAADDSLSTIEDQPLQIELAELLANDGDANHDALTFEMGTGPRYGTLSQLDDGTLRYQPDEDFHGADSFTYRVSDGTVVSAGWATVTVNVSPVNDQPVAAADQFVTAAGQPLLISAADLLSNDDDPEADKLVVNLATGPQHGTLNVIGDGQFEYVPNEGFAGKDSFRYQAHDGELSSADTEVTINVRSASPGLAAKPDVFSLAEDRHLVLNPERLLANDDIGDASQPQIELVDSPSHGRVRWTKDGSIVYVPNRDYNGLDRFNYRLSDGDDYSETVSVQLHVKSRNDPPLARPDIYRVAPGQVLRIRDEGVMENDLDRDGDDLRTTTLRGPQHGYLLLRRDGTFVYRPQRGFTGIDSFDYRLIDEDGAVTTARARILVSRAKPIVNPRPLIFETATTLPARSDSTDPPSSDPRPVHEKSEEGAPWIPPGRHSTPAASSNGGLAPEGTYSQVLRRLGLLDS